MLSYAGGEAANRAAQLERGDKHYLGCGDAILFAPRFPRWLERPGFWDELDIYQYQLAPLFTITFLDAMDGSPGRELPARQVRRRWTPAELTCEYELDDGLRGREHRSVLPGGYFASEWRLENAGDSERELLAVAWSAQPGQSLELTSVEATGSFIRFRRFLDDGKAHRLAVDVSLSLDEGLAAAAYLSEGANLDPSWEVTPFPEKWRGGPGDAVQVDGVNPRGVLYCGVAARFSLAPGGSRPLRAWARVRPQAAHPVMTGTLAAYIKEHAPPPSQRPSAAAIDAPAEPGAASRRNWEAYFDSVPQLDCSDPYIERYWYYRWYGLRLCAHDGGRGHLVYPGCCEGIGYFHVPIAYSAPCHARELRWLPDPDRARGVILNFLAQQKEDGQLHGRLYPDHLAGTDFYFADWGGAVLAVDEAHPDVGFLRAVYRPLTLYADWLDRERDADQVGLYDVVDHFETGQEYMSRYMAVSEDADSEVWGDRIRLKGVDATLYAYRLQRALGAIAERLGRPGEAAAWKAAADRTGVAIRRIMWDAQAQMFSDVDPETMRPTGVKAAVCFYPYLTDLVGREHLDGLRRHLLNPAEFWTPYPVPATSADDPWYSPDAEWKGKRHNCPWNGRVWPMTNSHVAEALARTATDQAPDLRSPAAELISRFVRMMFHDGDPARPNSYEHYNPETGRPSLYRGIDDYLHSWVNDLLVRYAAGLRPREGAGFVVDPLPFGIESLRLTRLPFRGRRVDVEIEGEEFAVRVDGADAGESRLGRPLEVGS